MGIRHYDPDEEGAAETWADEERQRRIDELLVPPVGVGPPGDYERRPVPFFTGYGRENHPGRKVDRESIARRIEG